MAHDLPGLASCPGCGSPAAAGADACAACGYRFLDDSYAGRHGRPAIRAARRRGAAVVAAAAALAAAGAATAIGIDEAGEAGEPRPERRTAAREERHGPDLLSSHPLSARAAERRLEARFTSLRDDDTASARCSALMPRPAHAIRYCRIRYPAGTERTVVVLTNPRGHELLVEPWSR